MQLEQAMVVQGRGGNCFIRASTDPIGQRGAYSFQEPSRSSLQQPLDCQLFRATMILSRRVHSLFPRSWPAFRQSSSGAVYRNAGVDTAKVNYEEKYAEKLQRKARE